MSATTERKRKGGDLHPSGDGRVFERYRSGCGSEVWLTMDQLEEKRRKAREYAARKNAANPEVHRERSRMWSKANPEKAKATIKKWKAANKERVKESDARWRAANPDVCRAQRAQRRAMKRNATHPEHSTEIEIALLQSAARLRECLGIDFHVDHIMPLARGGAHHHTNMRVIPGPLNLSKNNKLDSELPSHLLGALKQWSPFLN